MSKPGFKRYLLPSQPPASDWDTCRMCAARILWVPELGLWLDERQYGGAAPRGQNPQVPEHRAVCVKARSPREWEPPRATIGGVPLIAAEGVAKHANHMVVVACSVTDDDIVDAYDDALSEAVAQDALARLDIAAGTVDAEEWL